VELALELKAAAESPIATGFNPCFCGTGARTETLERIRDFNPCFNPCFCGTGARTSPKNCPLKRGVEFQSLFLWNWRSNAGPQDLAFRVDRVSILVFVELALELYHRMLVSHSCIVSILVFVELALEPR